jgi:RHS repeat-associated protein
MRCRRVSGNLCRVGMIVRPDSGVAGWVTGRAHLKTPTRRFLGTVSGFRYYNPSLQRWMSRDPIAEPGFRLLYTRKGEDYPARWVSGMSATAVLNLYTVVGNKPVCYVDPYGLEGMAQCWTDCMNTLVPFPLKICGAFSGLGALAAKVAGATTVGEVLLILPVWASGSGVGCFLGCLIASLPDDPPGPPNPWWPRPPGF